MSRLYRQGVESQAFGSRFKDLDGGRDAGDGKRTYTKQSPTLFVCGIPDAESSDRVAEVFKNDEGYLRCRPVSHHSNAAAKRRMCFIDFDTILNSTAAMQAHQGHKWEEVDEGLKIDYDDDPTKRMGDGFYEKFWPICPRKPKVETDEEMWSRLKAEQATAAVEASRKGTAQVALSVAGQSAKQRPKVVVGAKFQIRKTDGSGDAGDCAANGATSAEAKPPLSNGAGSSAEGCAADDCGVNEATQGAAARLAEPVAPTGVCGLLGYGDGSDDSSSDDEADDGGGKRLRLSVPDALL